MSYVSVRPSVRRDRGRAFFAVAASAAVALSMAALSVGGAAGAAGNGHHPQHESSFLGQFSTVTTIGSTVPGTGDQNPYGIVVVPRSIGDLVKGDTLISNFNDMGNTQGTGTTLVELNAAGTLTTFATIDPTKLPGACPGGVGLTTALAVLPHGFVVVGSLPVDSTGTPQAGCLIVLNSLGVPVETWSGGDINGPWDLTARITGSFTTLFVTNVLNGTVAAAGAQVNDGTVVRLEVVTPRAHMPRLLREKVIANGFPEQLNGAALVLGPTGVALGAQGTLYVADNIGNRIASIPHATSRQTVFGTPAGITVSSGGALANPLGLVTAPNGNLVAMNSNNGNAVEVEPDGDQIANPLLDSAGAGVLFGAAIAADGHGLLFVDDGDNTLRIFS